MSVQLHEAGDDPADAPPDGLSLPTGEWTILKFEWLCRLWPTMMPARAIGELLGMTKNQVIGVANTRKLGTKPNARGLAIRKQRAEAVARGEVPPPTERELRDETRKAETELRRRVRQEARAMEARLQAKRRKPPPEPGVLRLVASDGVQVQPQAPRRYVETLPPRCADTLALEGWMCRWPVGDPQAANFGYCGRHRDAVRDIPYCPHHAVVAYRGGQAETEEAA